MTAQVIRFRDYERHRDPDAVDRDPSESAVVIILPVVRVDHYDQFLDFTPRAFPATSFDDLREKRHLWECPGDYDDPPPRKRRPF